MRRRASTAGARDSAGRSRWRVRGWSGVAIAFGLCLALVGGVSGCDLPYLARAAYEESRLLWNRKPITGELIGADLAPEVRAKLQTALAVRQFARDELGLKVGGAYRTITQVDKDAVVYVVTAAPEDSLRPLLWWFPIVGRVPYRGYFDMQAAQEEAKELEAQGYDTLVRPAVAFSSLGFFDDPLLSNLLELDKVELAGVLIHELFHRTLYLPGQAMFDESAANFVGSRGAVDFFAVTAGAESPEAREACEIYRSDLRFADFLLQAQAELLRLYMSRLPRDEILMRRKQAFARIKAEYAALKPSLSGLGRFDLDKEPLNNAVLVNYLLYFHDLDNFSALERMNRRDTRATIKRIIELARGHPSDPFYAIWDATRSAPRESDSGPHYAAPTRRASAAESCFSAPRKK